MNIAKTMIRLVGPATQPHPSINVIEKLTQFILNVLNVTLVKKIAILVAIKHVLIVQI